MEKFAILLVTLSLGLVALKAQPTIIQQPTNQVLVVGGTMSLNVTASGTGPLAFQWFKDSRWLLGATNSTLTVTNTTIFQTGIYYVVVTNTPGMVISLPASVSVGNPALIAWGDNESGQLGNFSNYYTNMPFTITNGVVTGGVGFRHSLIVKDDGTLWAMGFNNNGQLGIGLPGNTNILVKVATGVISACGGQFHSLFVKTNGTLWAMGNNKNGQLGNGVSTITNLTPVSVASNVVAAATASFQSFFLTTNGTLWAMGANSFGQFGNGTITATNLVPVSVASNVVTMAAGRYHTLFVKRNGTLWATGRNQYGQLGNGTTNDTSSPISIASNVLAVAAGEYHSLFVKNDGTLWSVGRDNYGQLGNNTTNDISIPVSVATNLVALAAGYAHSIFTITNGTIWATGFNSVGTLGNGTTINTNVPNNVPNILVANIFEGLADHCMVIGINYNAGISLAGLIRAYTGNAIIPTATTTPLGLSVVFTYNGSTTPPTNSGAYTVIATINDPNYVGSVTNTLIVALPPQNFTINTTINNGILSLQLTGTTNYPYILQMATNLTPPVNWVSVVTNPADASGHWIVQVSYLLSTPQRFYRTLSK